MRLTKKRTLLRICLRTQLLPLVKKRQKIEKLTRWVFRAKTFFLPVFDKLALKLSLLVDAVIETFCFLYKTISVSVSNVSRNAWRVAFFTVHSNCAINTKLFLISPRKPRTDASDSEDGHVSCKCSIEHPYSSILLVSVKFLSR